MSSSRRSQQKKASERRRKLKEKKERFINETIYTECPSCRQTVIHRKVPFVYGYYCWQCSSCKADWYGGYI